MSIQVSSVPEQTGLSTAAEQRQQFFDTVLAIAEDAPASDLWIQALRDRAAVQAQAQSFPTTRNEDWRFTDLSELVQLSLAGGTDQKLEGGIKQLAPYLLPEAEGSRLVFVNGVYSADLSSVEHLPSNLLVGSLSTLLKNQTNRSGKSVEEQLKAYLGQQAGAEELFTTLNTTGLNDAAIVLVPKSQVVETPIHLLFLTTTGSATLVQPRCLLVAESSSSMTLVEEHLAIDEGAYFTNSVTEIWIADNAEVSHTRVQRDSKAAFHIGKTAVSQARDSRYTCHAISLGAKLSRHHLEIYQTGEQTQTVLNGLTLIQEEQLSDTHSTIALTQPHGTTRQLHKCIVDDRAHAVFNGKVFVPQAAQLTDAGQLNRNLLLSPKARVDTKPQLEIVADNVKCTHGAAVGQLDTDEVFYLQSRGIESERARRLLIYAFAYEVLDRIPIESLRQSLSQSIS